MAWHFPLWHWLAHAAVGGLVVLSVGCLAACLCRHAVRRLRLIELTLFGCLFIPWLPLLSGRPQWSIGLLDSMESPAVAETTGDSSILDDAMDRDRLDRAVLAARATQATGEKAAA